MPPLASIEGVPGHFAQGRIIDLKKGTSISFDQLIDDLRTIDLIFVGEVHDNPEHHLMEVQILQALLDRYGSLNVAMEFFDTTRQSALDSYMNKAVTETEFLKDVDWQNSWSFPFYFYRPLLLAARDKGKAVVGINVPNRIVRKVARSGLDSLNPEERGHVAETITLDNKAHRQYLNEVFEGHPHADVDNFDYFYQAQCVWEDTMAENIARHVKDYTAKTIVFTGNGHIINKFGIPDRVSRRIPVTTATILLYPLTDRFIINKNMADYIWLTDGCSSGGHGRRTTKFHKLGEKNKNENHTRKDR
ncbi:MAG: ChaN family lipoprotein [Deltaproteobacteria bacterium]|nr:ChaN family lipoprotein [Deltaproteobacteria bacterium]